MPSFDGYHRRDVPAPDSELTQVGPGTPVLAPAPSTYEGLNNYR